MRWTDFKLKCLVSVFLEKASTKSIPFESVTSYGGTVGIRNGTHNGSFEHPGHLAPQPAGTAGQAVSSSRALLADLQRAGPSSSSYELQQCVFSMWGRTNGGWMRNAWTQRNILDAFKE